MKITPIDIRHKEFKRSMRGYSEEEVDIFLDEVADDFELIFKENIELQDEIHRLKEKVAQYDSLRDTLQKTLVSAQQQADATQANARKEAELILKDAEIKARSILAESYAEKQKVQQSLLQLRQLEDDFRFKFKSLLESHLKLLVDDENSEERRRLRAAANGTIEAPAAQESAAQAQAEAEDTAPHPGPAPEEVTEPTVHPAQTGEGPAETPIPAPAAAATSDQASGAEPAAARTMVFGAADAYMSRVKEPAPGAGVRPSPAQPFMEPAVWEDRPKESRVADTIPAAAEVPVAERPAPSPRARDQFRDFDDLDFGPDLNASPLGQRVKDEEEEDADRERKPKKESSVRKFFFGSRGAERESGGRSDDRDFDW